MERWRRDGWREVGKDGGRERRRREGGKAEGGRGGERWTEERGEARVELKKV